MVNHDRQQFSWDPIKNRINITKHGISFFTAAKIFDGPRLEREDTRQNYGETRIIALGRSEGRILYALFIHSAIQSSESLQQERQTEMKEQNTSRQIHPF